MRSALRNGECIYVWSRFVLRTEVLCTPSSIWMGFKLMTSRSWQYISCHWDACSNHSAISDFSPMYDTRICTQCCFLLLGLICPTAMNKSYGFSEVRTGYSVTEYSGKWWDTLWLRCVLTLSSFSMLMILYLSRVRYICHLQPCIDYNIEE